MKMLNEYTNLARQYTFALIGVMLCSYFCFHMLLGERGYLRLSALRSAQVEAQAVLVDVEGRRQVLEGDVVMLRPGSVDRDFLEERARHVLGFVYDGEVEVL